MDKKMPISFNEMGINMKQLRGKSYLTSSNCASSTVSFAADPPA